MSDSSPEADLAHDVEVDVEETAPVAPVDRGAVEEAPSATQLSVLPTPVPDETGVPAVDAALDRLTELADLDGDPEQQVAVFEDVHDRLQAALSGPDESAR